MSPMEVFYVMTDGDAKAEKSLLRMAMSENFSFSDLLLLDSMGIYGRKLHTFWSRICKRSGKRLGKVMLDLKSGKLSKEEIEKTLAKRFFK